MRQVNRADSTACRGVRGLKPLFCSVLLLLIGGCSFPKVIVLQDPLSPAEHLQLGERYEAEGEIDLALAEYEAALAGGERAEVFAHLGNAYSLKGDVASAESYYLKSLKAGPDQPLVLNNLAALYATRGIELSEAEEMLKKAIALDPEHRAYFLETLSEVYLAGERMDAALAALQEAEASAPSDPLLRKSLELQRARIRARACDGPCDGPGGGF